MTTEEIQKLMEFILQQQANIVAHHAQFEESTNRKIDFLLDQQAKINTNVQLLTEIALSSALESDQLKQEIRGHFTNLDSRLRKLEDKSK